MTLAERVDPAPTVWFDVMFTVSALASPMWAVVRSISGLGMTVTTTPLWEGGQWFGPHMLVGPVSMSKLVLQGVVTEKHLFYDWFHLVQAGQLTNAYGEGTIKLSQSGPGGVKPVARWHVTRALPVAYSAPAMDGAQTVIALERLEVVYETLERTRG